MASAEMVTSLGRSGEPEIRSYGRIGMTLSSVVDNSDAISRRLHAFSSVGNVRPERLIDYPLASVDTRRSFVRAIVGQEAIEAALSNGLLQSIEIAAPIGEGLYYINAAKNGENRRNDADKQEELMTRTEPRGLRETPQSLVSRIIDEGYSFQSRIGDEKGQNEVQALWGEAFEWRRDQVVNLATRLEHDKDISSDPVWFSSLVSADGEIVSAAMAEKLSIEGNGGETIDIVELTEWSVAPQNRGNGYMSANVTMLIAQVLHDYEQENDVNRKLVIMAECNIDKYAHSAGYKAGLTVPERQIFGKKVSQILERNVEISGELQDFAFMYLSGEGRSDYYGGDTVQELISNYSDK